MISKSANVKWILAGYISLASQISLWIDVDSRKDSRYIGLYLVNFGKRVNWSPLSYMFVSFFCFFLTLFFSWAYPKPNLLHQVRKMRKFKYFGFFFLLPELEGRIEVQTKGWPVLTRNWKCKSKEISKMDKKIVSKILPADSKDAKSLGQS